MATIKTAIEIDVNTSASTQQSVKSFKQQLKELKIEAQNAVIQFGEFSPEALKAQQAVANLDDKMQDFNDRVKALNPDKFSKVLTVTQGITQGFQAAQGALALFGADTEDLQKQLVKVQGAMALAQGLEGLGKIQQQFTAIIGTVTGPVIAAFNTLRASIGSALAFTGVGALLIGLTVVINKILDYRKQLQETAEKQAEIDKHLQTIQDESLKIQNQELETVGKLVLITEKENVSKQDKIKAIKEIQNTYPDYLKNQNLDKVTTQDIDIANKKLIETIVQRAKAQAALNELNKIFQKQIELETKLNKEDANSLKERFDLANKGLSPNEIAKQTNSLNNLRNVQNQKIQSDLQDLKIQEKRIKNYIDENKLTDHLTSNLKSNNETAATSVKAKTKDVKEEVLGTASILSKGLDLKDPFQEIELNLDNLQHHHASTMEILKAGWLAYGDTAITTVTDSLSAISALNEAFAGKSEEEQKKAFELDKALKYASTVLSTIQGVQNAFTTAEDSPFAKVFPAYPFIQAAAAAAFGIAQLKKISDTQYQSKTTPSSSGMGASGYVAPPTLRASTISNADNLTQNRKVFVTEGDITKTIRRVSANQQVSVVE